MAPRRSIARWIGRPGSKRDESSIHYRQGLRVDGLTEHDQVVKTFPSERAEVTAAPPSAPKMISTLKK